MKKAWWLAGALLGCGGAKDAGSASDRDAAVADGSAVDGSAPDAAVVDAAVVDAAIEVDATPDAAALRPFGGDRPARLRLPAGHDPAQRWPLIVLLHGH